MAVAGMKCIYVGILLVSFSTVISACFLLNGSHQLPLVVVPGVLLVVMTSIAGLTIKPLAKTMDYNFDDSAIGATLAVKTFPNAMITA